MTAPDDHADRMLGLIVLAVLLALIGVAGFLLVVWVRANP